MQSSVTRNIAAALPRLALATPEQAAMRTPGRLGRYSNVLSYAQLDARSDAIAAGLGKRGIARGSRVVVMVRPTPEFFLL
ncbi:MAG TPA: AMP-binding protein, partial [Thermomonas sp.]|nr:AMP-binding protein [Thermomonas sp.]